MEKGSVDSLKGYSIAGYALMVLALLCIIYNRGLFSGSVFVIAVQILSALLMVWARVTFRSRSFHFAANPTEGGLVTTGPYRFVRHPIYASVLYFAAAGAAANLSLLNGGFFILLAAGVGIRIYCEEKLILRQYPEYADYSRRTRRIIPFVF